MPVETPAADLVPAPPAPVPEKARPCRGCRPAQPESRQDFAPPVSGYGHQSRRTLNKEKNEKYDECTVIGVQFYPNQIYIVRIETQVAEKFIERFTDWKDEAMKQLQADLIKNP